jgi:serine phosphatase RsbU (regulator of sigma subunit)
MAQTQAYLRALAECHGRPGDLLTHANRLFSRNDSGHFVTLFLCRLNPWARSFTYAAAGHQAYLVHADGEARVLFVHKYSARNRRSNHGA